MTTQKPVLAVDCDDVLLDFMRALFLFLNIRLGRNYAYEDLVSYNLAELLSLAEAKKQEYVEEFYLTPAFSELLPVEGAIQAVGELALLCTLVVVTSRHKEHVPHTRANLARHYPGMFDEMHLLDHYNRTAKPQDRESKGLICKRINAIACIEDGPGNAREIAEHGVPVILLDRPWNRMALPPLVTRVHSWPEIVGAVHALINKEV